MTDTNTTGFYFLADHPVLDFLNTVVQTDGQPQDLWQSDDDVKNWLSSSGLVLIPPQQVFPAGTLLAEARQLRDIIRTLISAHKQQQPLIADSLNQYLTAAVSHISLQQQQDGSLQAERLYQHQTASQLLAPIAEQAAALLATANFELVRECEHPQCSLWFYDTTKAHRRRWCSMALCGNRAKVARFRQKQD
ncbi:ABATE domain-containing protein [Chromatiaceae bacterium AAb-1]|nr:ABATE domain-containing protein [Chromatiaceae bacterium AAb-1]